MATTFSTGYKNHLLDSLENAIGGTVSGPDGMCLQARSSTAGTGTVRDGVAITFAAASAGSKAMSGGSATLSIAASEEVVSIGLYTYDTSVDGTDVLLLGYKNLASPITFTLANQIIITAVTLSLS